MINEKSGVIYVFDPSARCTSNPVREGPVSYYARNDNSIKSGTSLIKGSFYFILENIKEFIEKGYELVLNKDQNLIERPLEDITIKSLKRSGVIR